ncbi:MAG: Maf family nucleotide pyrophosphatase [Zoogloeaceae bacterium]|jgi:septum formation protein|nr:Maf family nucleotide pyrophosphatase [Zoogloeaceae bacterium]
MSIFSPPTLILASASPFRRELLARLGLPFRVAIPDCDETPRPGEDPETLSLRLSETKARAVLAAAPWQFADTLIIGSDQVAVCAGKIYGKPGNPAAAAIQLRELSGRRVHFFTGLCLLDPRTRDKEGKTEGTAHRMSVATTVTFRHLSEDEIKSYLAREPDALNCAGSAKSEGLGIALIAKMEGTDPNALIGLPLIALCDLLRAAGVAVLRGA